jgi:hypothetical protein
LLLLLLLDCLRVSPQIQRVVEPPSELFSSEVEVERLLCFGRFLLPEAFLPPLLFKTIQLVTLFSFLFSFNVYPFKIKIKRKKKK